MDALIPNDVSPATLADFASEALLEVDDGLVIQANAAARQLLTGSRGNRSLVGLELASIFEPAPSPSDKPQCLRGRRLDGARIALRASITAGERPNHMFLRLCPDPSHDEAAERAVIDRESTARAQRLAQALDLSEDFVVLIDCEEVRFLDANEAALRIGGLGYDEFMQKRPWELVSPWISRERLERSYDKLIAMSPAARRERNKLTSLRTGRTADFDVKMQALKIAGRWVIVVTGRDVTDRLQGQARLERMAAALDSVEEAICLVDRATMRYVDVNQGACALLGYSRKELLARMPNQASEELDSLDDLAARYDRLIAKAPATESEEMNVRRSDGSHVVCEVRRKALRASDGRWVIVANLRDLAQPEEASERVKLLAKAADLSEDAIGLIDRATMSYVALNYGACNLFGYSRDEMFARGPVQIAANRNREALAAIYDNLIEIAPATLSSEQVARHRDGTYFPCETRRQAFRIDGRWIIVVNTRDIRARKAAQARTELLAYAMNGSSDYILLFDRERMACIDANEAALAFHGVDRETLLNVQPWKLGSDTSTREEVASVFDKAIAIAPASVGTVQPMRRLNGEGTATFEVRRKALWVDGRWVILETARDVTERLREQAQIERLARAIEMSEDAIAITDRESMTYLYVNPAMSRLVGVPREQLIGARRPTLEAMAPIFDEVIRQAPAMQKTERDVLHDSGISVPCEVRRQALVSEGRWIIVTNQRDISERRQAEEDIRQKVAELIRSNQDLEQFAYVTSHDLSEPLRMVASYTQLLERRYSGQFDQDAREFMGYIVEGARRMKQLIDDLLLYSRAGRPNVQMKLLALDRALDDALANLAHAIGTSGATIERSALPRIVADRFGMVQVFQNLIGNAIKFRAESTVPVVRVQAEDAGTEWLVSISDNGIGIAPEYFQRIFVIFQRLHARSRYEGTGIGLSICKKVVERHGGRIDVASELGQGTTFRIHLPKDSPQAAEGSTTPADMRLTVGASRKAGVRRDKAGNDT